MDGTVGWMLAAIMLNSDVNATSDSPFWNTILSMLMRSISTSLVFMPLSHSGSMCARACGALSRPGMESESPFRRRAEDKLAITKRSPSSFMVRSIGSGSGPLEVGPLNVRADRLLGSPALECNQVNCHISGFWSLTVKSRWALLVQLLKSSGCHCPGRLDSAVCTTRDL